MPAPPEHTPLARAIRRRLLRHPELVPRDSRILVALSGGRDSVVLLHLLRFGAVASCEVHAAHFDHAMRAGSEADRAWARGLARAWAVPFTERRAPRGLRGEAEARAARYAFLDEVAAKTGAARIATAHHAGDQVETVLFRLLRGTGAAGLAGIPQRRGAYVRPLLTFSPRRLAAYATVTGVRWREDPSNLDTRYRRNALRHQVLPVLERKVPGFGRALAHLGRSAAEAERVLHPLIESAAREAVTREGDAFVLARDVLQGYDPWTRARVIRRTLQRAGGRVDRTTIRTFGAFVASARRGAALELGGGLQLTGDFDRFVLFRPIAHPADRPLRVGAAEGRGTALIGGAEVRLIWGPEASGIGRSVPLDLQALRFPLTLRGWQPGDRIRLPYGTKKLKKLFAERRVARVERNRVPVLSDAAGHVLWAVGIAAAEPARPRPGHTTLHFTVLE